MIIACRRREEGYRGYLGCTRELHPHSEPKTSHSPVRNTKDSGIRFNPMNTIDVGTVSVKQLTRTRVL